MPTEDVLLQNLSIKLFGFWVVTGETLFVVGNIDTTVAGTFKGTEDTGTGRGALQADVEEGLEGTGGTILVNSLSELEGAIGFSNTLVLVGKTELGKGATGSKETSGIG